MIDLHTHILPGLDDGATSLEMSVEMAQLAVADGITHLACTPHIVPGLYNNDAAGIAVATAELARKLVEQEIRLELIIGADIHVAPDLCERLVRKEIPTIGGTRYFLLEPPHHVKPPGLDRLVHDLIDVGYIPILTHPERLTWIEQHYDAICRLGNAGVKIQLTAGSVTGRFGSRAKYWSERMLDERLVDIIASDAHDTKMRPPALSRARDRIADRLGAETARRMTLDYPLQILRDCELRKADKA